MNKLRYQTFLLTRILQGNAFPSTAALLEAIDAAIAIPEEQWSDRKAAFNAIGVKAPLRDTSDLAITHSCIPAFLEREWREFSYFANATKNIKRAPDLDEKVQGFWIDDSAFKDAYSETTGGPQ